jgi:hypothetical protein
MLNECEESNNFPKKSGISLKDGSAGASPSRLEATGHMDLIPL